MAIYGCLKTSKQCKSEDIQISLPEDSPGFFINKTSNLQKLWKQTLECLTPWKINMEPENDGLEDGFPFQLGDF